MRSIAVDCAIAAKLCLPQNMEPHKIARLCAYFQGFTDPLAVSAATGITPRQMRRAWDDKTVRYWMRYGIEGTGEVITYSLPQAIGWIKCGTCGRKITKIPCQKCMLIGKQPTVAAMSDAAMAQYLRLKGWGKTKGLEKRD